MCESLFQEELRHDGSRRIEWLTKKEKYYPDEVFAVLVLSSWLDSPHSVADTLNIQCITRLRSSKLGKFVLTTLKTDALPKVLVHGEDAQLFYETRANLIARHRAGEMFSAQEMGNYSRLLHRVLRGHPELYRAVVDTKPPEVDARSYCAWMLVVPGGIFLPDEASIDAINEYLGKAS